MLFNYILDENTVIFSDTLTSNFPYVSKKPRNHESLFFVTNGALLYEKEDSTVIINKGQVGYIKRGSTDKSSAYNCDKVSYVAINFSFDKDNLCPTLPFETLILQSPNYNYENLFKEALNCFLYKTPGYIAICNGIVLQIIGSLYSESKNYNANFKKLHRIKDSIEYLKSNYSDNDLSIAFLAKLSDMSEKQYRRIFTNIYQKTPYRFMIELRIEKSKILLSNTQKSITEIAHECGFSDIYSFSHSFKNHTGVSPKDYNNMQI